MHVNAFNKTCTVVCYMLYKTDNIFSKLHHFVLS